MSNISLPKLPKLDNLPKVNLGKVNFPKIDLPKVNVPKVNLPKVNVPKLSIPTLHSIDLTSLDLRKNLDSALANPVVKQAKEAGYTAVGFVVLGVQKAQVRRRELLARITSRRNTAQ